MRRRTLAVESVIKPDDSSRSAVAGSAPAYAELYCRSSFSFGVGASQPEELVARAHALGYAALALTDECSVAGMVRAHVEAKKRGLKLLPGAEFVVPLTAPARLGGHAQNGVTAVVQSVSFTLVALPRDLAAWGDLCEFITAARRSAPKGQYQVAWPDPSWARLQGCEVLLVLQNAITLEAACAITNWARGQFGINCWLALAQLLQADDALLWHKLHQVAQRTQVPLVAVGSVLMHLRSRKPLQDVLTAVRLGQPLADCGLALQPNAEAHLRSRARLAQIYPPELLANTCTVAARCQFSLDEFATNIPSRRCCPARPRRKRCGNSPSRAPPGATHKACPLACNSSWRTSWR